MPQNIHTARGRGGSLARWSSDRSKLAKPGEVVEGASPHAVLTRRDFAVFVGRPVLAGVLQTHVAEIADVANRDVFQVRVPVAALRYIRRYVWADGAQAAASTLREQVTGHRDYVTAISLGATPIDCLVDSVIWEKRGVGRVVLEAEITPRPGGVNRRTLADERAFARQFTVPSAPDYEAGVMQLIEVPASSYLDQLKRVTRELVEAIPGVSITLGQFGCFPEDDPIESGTLKTSQLRM